MYISVYNIHEPPPLKCAESALMAGGEGESAQATARALATEHLYYEDTELFSCTAHVSGQWETEVNGEKRTVVVLDRTVMHPQGGGNT